MELYEDQQLNDYVSSVLRNEALRKKKAREAEIYGSLTGNDPTISTAASGAFPGQTQVNYGGILSNALGTYMGLKGANEATDAEGEAQQARLDYLNAIMGNQQAQPQPAQMPETGGQLRPTPAFTDGKIPSTPIAPTADGGQVTVDAAANFTPRQIAEMAQDATGGTDPNLRDYGYGMGGADQVGFTGYKPQPVIPGGTTPDFAGSQPRKITQKDIAVMSMLGFPKETLAALQPEEAPGLGAISQLAQTRQGLRMLLGRGLISASDFNASMQDMDRQDQLRYGGTGRGGGSFQSQVLREAQEMFPDDPEAAIDWANTKIRGSKGLSGAESKELVTLRDKADAISYQSEMFDGVVNALQDADLTIGDRASEVLTTAGPAGALIGKVFQSPEGQRFNEAIMTGVLNELGKVGGSDTEREMAEVKRMFASAMNTPEVRRQFLAEVQKRLKIGALATKLRYNDVRNGSSSADIDYRAQAREQLGFGTSGAGGSLDSIQFEEAN